MPANGTFFVTYEVVQNYLSKISGSNETTMGASIIAGGLAGMSYWILGMPADVVKSRLQTAPEGTYKRGVRDVLPELLKKEGPAALYKGVTPVMIRAFPANAACFFGIELVNWLMSIVAPNF